jgi:hypothetical protein
VSGQDVGDVRGSDVETLSRDRSPVVGYQFAGETKTTPGGVIDSAPEAIWSTGSERRSVPQVESSGDGHDPSGENAGPGEYLIESGRGYSSVQ